MGVLVIIAFFVAIVALMTKSVNRRKEEQEAAWIREEREEEIRREKVRQQQRLEEERLQQQQRLEDAGLSESCLQFAQRMKEHPMIVEEGEKLLQEAILMLQKELNDALTNESSVYFSFSVSSWGAHCNPPGSYAFNFASHGISLLESSEGMPVWAKTAGIAWALWRQINEPLLNAVPALSLQSVDWSYDGYKTLGSGTLRMEGVLKQDRFMKL